jgi:acyl transferase domain-containing protein
MSLTSDAVSEAPIAVVGYSCRLPGAPDPEAFWRLLAESRHAITGVPPERWDGDALGATGGATPDAERARWGGFVDGPDLFDADFFGISPREAAAMDPQQRLVLELGWEALEHAGVVPAALAGTGTGVFVGATLDDYALLRVRLGAAGITRHTTVGTQRSMIANRLSYLLGVHGPSHVVDSGQSSSLVAVHLACESLRSGACTAALAGGVNLNLALDTALATAASGALSPDGRCHTFDARANGYVRGEGGALVLLKTLDQALADGDPVRCLILGGAVSNGGGAAGLTVPDADAQRTVILLAHRRARTAAKDVQYVELHGTGTKVGDPVEAAALGAAIGKSRPAGQPLLVGSAKTNVGHLEGAAGVVGLLKVILSIEHQALPASLNFTTPNPLIPLDELNLGVQRELGPWPEAERPRIAGVSSFGMGGTNCHLVVSDWRGNGRPPEAPEPPSSVVPVLVSGRSEQALRAQAARLLQHLGDRPGLDLAGIAHSAAVTRTHFDHRAALLAHDQEDLLEGLVDLAEGRRTGRAVQGVARLGGLAFLFTGQGSQRPGMCGALHEAYPAFADTLDAVCEEFDAHLDLSLRGLVLDGAGSPDAALLDQTLYTQASLFAYETALFRLLEHWGITPEAVMGHSVGELVAAHVAGVIGLRDACTLVAARGRLMQRLPSDGAMVSVQATHEEIRATLAGREGRIDVAAVNGPAMTVLSGDEGAVLGLADEWRQRGRKTKRLKVSHAFHSAHMDAMLAEFRVVAESLTYRPPRIPIVSNLTGQAVTADEICWPDHWVRHARDSVRFLDGMRTLDARGIRTYLEVGPDAVLSVMGRDCVPSQDAVFVSAARATRAEVPTLMSAIAEIHVSGVPVAWDRVLAWSGDRRVPLPTYAFQRQRHWLTDSAVPQTPPPAGSSDEALPDATEQSAASGSDSDSAASGSDFDSAGELVRRLAVLAPGERDRALSALVRAQVARVLGRRSAAEVPMERSFKELGFDSLMGVELRDLLFGVTGIRLPSTLIFDYPTPGALVGLLRDEVPGGEESIAGAGGLGGGSSVGDEDLIDAMDVAELVRMARESAES